MELLPHQKRGLAWMLHREQAAGKPAVPGGLLADDQGLGKTVTTIALLLSHPPSQVRLGSSPWFAVALLLNTQLYRCSSADAPN